MRLLYITRKYPPMIGGMEQLSYALSQEFPKEVETTLISWGKSQKYLPFVFFYFLFVACFLIPKKKITHILIGDALLSPLGVLLKTLFNKKVLCTVVGLDITFNFPGYQVLIPWCVNLLDKIICISDATKRECTIRGISPEKCSVIPCGVYAKRFYSNAKKKDLENILTFPLSNKKILITVGRLVKRKGVRWFVKNVIPKLSTDILYLVIGDGPEKKVINHEIERLHLQKRVYLLGKISDVQLKIFYNTADLFVMPNIKVEGTIEGFGIVAIEASAAGLPVVASDIEGIKAAVIENKNGHTVTSGKARNWIDTINNTLYSDTFQKNYVKSWTVKNYDWHVIGRKYIQEMEKI